MSDLPFSSFYFRLSFLGAASKLDVAFQEISGLSVQIDTEEVTCGGENRFKYRLPKLPKYQNLVLKRGVTYMDSPLRTWCSNTFKNGLNKGIEPKDLEIVLLDENADPCFQWVVYKAYPVAWQASVLNAEKSELMIETIELSFNYFEAEMQDNQDAGFGNLFG